MRGEDKDVPYLCRPIESERIDIIPCCVAKAMRKNMGPTLGFDSEMNSRVSMQSIL